MSHSSESDRREQTRIWFRTPLLIITLDRQAKDIRPVLVGAWTEDVSLSGAQILTRTPVPDGHVWIRFAMPGASEQLIEARIVRQTYRKTGRLFPADDTLHVYGVKFFRLIKEVSVIEWIMSTIRGEIDGPVPTHVSEQFEAIRGSSEIASH